MYLKKSSTTLTASAIPRHIVSGPNLPRLPTVLICILIAIGAVILTILVAYFLRDHDWKSSKDEISTKRRVKMSFGTLEQKEEDQKRTVKKGWKLDEEPRMEMSRRTSSSSHFSHKSRKSFYQSPKSNTLIQSTDASPPALSEAMKARLGVGKNSQSSLGFSTVLKAPKRTRTFDSTNIELEQPAPKACSSSHNSRNPHRDSEILTPAEAHARLRAVQEEGMQKLISLKGRVSTRERYHGGECAASQAGSDFQSDSETFLEPQSSYNAMVKERESNNGISGITDVVSEKFVRKERTRMVSGVCG